MNSYMPAVYERISVRLICISVRKKKKNGAARFF